MSSSVSSDLLAGAGVMLHFRWQLLMLCWSIMVLLMLVGSKLYLDGAAAGTMHLLQGNPMRINSMSECDTPEEAAESLEVINHVEEVLFYLCLMLYLISFVGIIIFSIRQRIFFADVDEQHATMEDYVLIVGNLPKNEMGDGRTEKELPNGNVIGVSIAWKYVENEDEIQQQ